MLIQVFDPDISSIKEWLSQRTIPVVVFAFSLWRRAEKCRIMKEFLEQLAQKPEHKNDVLFCWFNLDDGYGEALRSIGINDTPHVKIFMSGEERESCVDISTVKGIITRLNILLDPAKRHCPARRPLVTAGEESPFHF